MLSRRAHGSGGDPGVMPRLGTTLTVKGPAWWIRRRTVLVQKFYTLPILHLRLRPTPAHEQKLK